MIPGGGRESTQSTDDREDPNIKKKDQGVIQQGDESIDQKQARQRLSRKRRSCRKARACAKLRRRKRASGQRWRRADDGGVEAGGAGIAGRERAKAKG